MSEPTTVSRLELRLLRLAALVSTTMAAALLVCLLHLGTRVARAEAAEREVTDRLARIYERVRRVQLLVEQRNAALGVPVPAEPDQDQEPAKPGGR